MLSCCPSVWTQGMEHGNGTSAFAPSEFRSLPATLNAEQYRGRRQIPNSSSDTRLMHDALSGSGVLQNEERIPLQQDALPDRSSSIFLREESDGEIASPVFQPNLSRHNSSMSGNPVCHPEQEGLVLVVPTTVITAAEPHMSFDPDKPCNTTNGHLMSSTASDHSISETFCKSSRWIMLMWREIVNMALLLGVCQWWWWYWYVSCYLTLMLLDLWIILIAKAMLYAICAHLTW